MYAYEISPPIFILAIHNLAPSSKIAILRSYKKKDQKLSCVAMHGIWYSNIGSIMELHDVWDSLIGFLSRESHRLRVGSTHFCHLFIATCSIVVRVDVWSFVFLLLAVVVHTNLLKLAAFNLTINRQCWHLKLVSSWFVNHHFQII